MDDQKCEIFAFELSPLPNSEMEGGEGEGERKSEGEMEQGAAAASSVPGRKHSKESDSDTETLPTKIFKSEEQTSSREGNSPPAPVVIPTDEPPAAPMADDDPNPAPRKGDAPVINKAVVVEWHSCAICLEEMVDSELVTHASCGAILCPSCLQSSVDHYQKEDGLVPCPVRIVQNMTRRQFYVVFSILHFSSLLGLYTYSHTLFSISVGASYFRT